MSEPTSHNATAAPPRPPRSRRGHLVGVIFVTTLIALLWSCASGPETGVRTEYRESNIESVAIVPFYTGGSFGLDGDEQTHLRTEYERAATSALEAQGLEVIDSRAFEQLLTEHGISDEFHQGVRLRQRLELYFEPAATGERQPLEIRTLRDLASDHEVFADTLLFGEIIYHSAGTCRELADDNNPYAVSSISPSAPTAPPRPCVSSHFQAKLVDARTGRAMWFNRAFVEHHVPRIDDSVVSTTLSETVERTLGGDGGITPLAPGRVDDNHRVVAD